MMYANRLCQANDRPSFRSKRRQSVVKALQREAQDSLERTRLGEQASGL
jgi:hypothetical protein